MFDYVRKTTFFLFCILAFVYTARAIETCTVCHGKFRTYGELARHHETSSCGQELLNRSTAHLEQSLTQHTGFHTVLPHVAPVYYGPIPTYVQPSQQYYHPSTSSATYTQAVNPSTSTAYTGPTTRYRSAMKEFERDGPVTRLQSTRISQLQNRRSQQSQSKSKRWAY